VEKAQSSKQVKADWLKGKKSHDQGNNGDENVQLDTKLRRQTERTARRGQVE